MNSAAKPDRFDLILAGAGMVGSCAALALAQAGYRIALIEAAAAVDYSTADNQAYDLRVSAISPTSQEILEQLGVWSHINQSRICDYSRMRVWHENGDASLFFDSAEIAREKLGSIVENREILGSLTEACLARPQIEWFSPERIKKIDENSSKRVLVTLESGLQLEADLLIAADGRHSPTRQLAGIDIVTGEYNQTAIVANVETELSHQHTAWQRFLSTGPLAFLPLANGMCSIVWSCDTDFANELLAKDDNSFCFELTRAFESTLGKVVNTGERRSFPLGWHSCAQWLNNRVLLIGDAAHSVHPLAGQGVNLGFSDVSRLIQILNGSNSAWDRKKLRKFERERKSQTLLATHMLSGLKWIYGLESRPVDKLLDLGMNAIQSNAVCRRNLMLQAIHNMV